MDDAADASHDTAQHSAASALATMGGPPALGRSSDLTGLSSDEVQMPFCFFNHSNMAVLMTVNNKLHEPESSLVMSFEMAFHLHVSESCLQHIDNKRNTSLLCQVMHHHGRISILRSATFIAHGSLLHCTALHHCLMNCLLQVLRLLMTRLSAMDQRTDQNHAMLLARLNAMDQRTDQGHAMTQAAAHHLSQLSSLVSGGVGVGLQTYQMLVQSGVHPTHAGLPAKRTAADREGTQAPATQSARTRRKAEANWQRHLQKQRMAQLAPPSEQQLDEQAAAPRPEPSAQASGAPATSVQIPRDPLETMEGLPGMTASQPPARPGLPAASMPAAGVNVGHTAHPDIPGTGQTAPWTEWRGAYLNLSGDMTK